MENMLNTFQALSDSIRLRILKLLDRGELCVCDIVTALDMVQPKVSFHLRILKKAGLIKDRKQGKWIHYRLDDSQAFNRFLLLSVMEKIPENAISGDQERLDEFMRSKKEKGVPDRNIRHCGG